MRIVVFILSLLTSGVCVSQTYPRNYFRSPMDITLRLSGNFGELRPNHFHAGIDITTQGVEGLTVRASADGYVSRIKISPWGYGKAVYVTHPNGYTTVYAHLSDYSGAIGDWVENQQYLAQSFEVDLYPTAGELPVIKGQEIAKSGNTGGSGGPHLHFEIRDSQTEEAINPLLFGLPIADAVAPTPVTLAVYASQDGSYVNATSRMKKSAFVKSGNKYVLQNSADSIVVYGSIGFGVEAYDKESIPQGKNGVYGIRLQEGDKIIYEHHLERIAFEDSRYVNCFVDYAEHERNGKYFQLSFLQPNNLLPVYDTTIDRGFVVLNDGKYHKFTYTVYDAYGNKSVAEFKVKALSKLPEAKYAATEVSPYVQVLLWDKPNRIEENDFTFETPERSVYDNTTFKWTSKKGSAQRLSSVITINDRFTPLHKACTLTIAMPSTTRANEQLVMIREKSNGGVTSVGGKWNGKGVSAEIKEFGSYAIMRDSIAPTIKPANYDKGGKTENDFSAMKAIDVKIGDNLSGIQAYRGTIDGKWILFEYEPKKDLLRYTFDSHVGKGSHILTITVTDKCGNMSVYSKTFTR